MLKPKIAFPETHIEDVISYLKYSGKTKSIDDMEQAIQQGIKEHFSDNN